VNKNNDFEQEDPTESNNHEKVNTIPKIPNFSELIIHLLRAIYYFGLLFLIGWIFLWRLVKNYASDVKKKYLFWGIIVQMLHLVGLLSVILIQMNIFTINGLSFTPNFPFQTTFGLLWIVSLFMSLFGFVFLFKNQWLDIFWIVVIVFSKSLNGHALEFEPTVILVITNSIHLLAASIWAAGLMFIILFWRKHIIYVKSFLPQFSKYAFFSIVILSITGIFISYVYLSGFDLLFSDRGILLMIKTVIVLLIILVGVMIRYKMKDMQTVDLKRWIKLDFLLMFLIIIIVSILTYLNPLQ
jgi:copper transport protein